MKSPLGVFIQIGCGVFFIIGVFLCSAGLFFTKAQSDKFWQTGVHVDGVVLRIEEEEARGLQKGTYYIASEKVQFEYLIEGQIFRDWDDFGYDTSFYVGQTVPVIYDPHEPWNAQIIADTSPALNKYLPIVVGTGILALVALMLFMMRSPRGKQKRKNEEKHGL